MARALTSAAATEAAKQTGAAFVRVLEVRWDSGTEYYSTLPLTSPVVAAGRVLEFAVRQLDAQPGKAASMQTMTLKLADPDLSLKAKFDAQPGVQTVVALVHLYFIGTTWPTDRVTEIAGVLTTPMQWDESEAAWTITLRGLEHLYDQDVGEPLVRDEWPEVSCSDCEGEIIPIAYGRPVRRVPACVVDRPGSDVLALPFLGNPPQMQLTISRPAAEAGFTFGSPTSLIVGHPGNWERVWGIFSESDSTLFTVFARGSWIAVGTVSTYGAEGQTWITISDADLPDGTSGPPVASASRGGHAILLQRPDFSWVATVVTNWKDVGGNRIAVCLRGNLGVNDGAQYRLLATPGMVPSWPPGTPVYEEGSWTYAVNYLPSEEVERVEARGSVTVNGESKEAWYTFDPFYYDVNLDDKQFNARLGREEEDPGLTTVTLDFSPVSLGFSEETIWVTLKGIVGGEPDTSGGGGKFVWSSESGFIGAPSGEGEALSNPAEVIHHLLNNPFLGGIPDEFVDHDSFASAAPRVPTLFAFAILDRRSLHDVVSDLAHQATCLYFWDQGRAVLRKLTEEIDSGDSLMTFTQSNVTALSLRIEEVSVKDYTTLMQGRFRLSVPSPELKIARRAPAALQDFGRQTDELDLWAYQYPTSVARTVEFWLSYRLHLNRLVTFDTYLNALALQPGDVVLLDYGNGAGVQHFDEVPARIRSVRQTPANAVGGQMERVQIVAELSLFGYEIEQSDPDDDECPYRKKSGEGATRHVIRERKLFVRSDGINSMYVMMPRLMIETGTVGESVENPSDPTGGSQSWGGIVFPPGPPDPPSESSGGSSESSDDSSGPPHPCNIKCDELTLSISGGCLDGLTMTLVRGSTCSWTGQLPSHPCAVAYVGGGVDNHGHVIISMRVQTGSTFSNWHIQADLTGSGDPPSMSGYGLYHPQEGHSGVPGPCGCLDGEVAYITISGCGGDPPPPPSSSGSSAGSSEASSEPSSVQSFSSGSSEPASSEPPSSEPPSSEPPSSGESEPASSAGSSGESEPSSGGSSESSGGGSSGPALGNCCHYIDNPGGCKAATAYVTEAECIDLIGGGTGFWEEGEEGYPAGCVEPFVCIDGICYGDVQIGTFSPPTGFCMDECTPTSGCTPGICCSAGGECLGVMSETSCLSLDGSFNSGFTSCEGNPCSS